MNLNVQITKVFHTNCSRATNEKKFLILSDSNMIFLCLLTSNLIKNFDLYVEEISFTS